MSALHNLIRRKQKSLDSKPRPIDFRRDTACRIAVSKQTGQAPSLQQDLLCFYSLGFNHHKVAHRALVDELDAPRDLGEEGVVFAASNVQSRLNSRATLADDDRASGNQLSAESFEPKPLRVRVAPVS